MRPSPTSHQLGLIVPEKLPENPPENLPEKDEESNNLKPKQDYQTKLVSQNKQLPLLSLKRDSQSTANYSIPSPSSKKTAANLKVTLRHKKKP